jgi:signal-transduction protein with cAMP-binding, CBS, and nucleotidyltransferase domain
MTTKITSIGQLMTEKLETIALSNSAQQAAKKMRDKNVSSLVVVDNYDKPTGIVTERDLVRKVCVHDASSSSTLLKDIMSSHTSFWIVVWVFEDTLTQISYGV